MISASMPTPVVTSLQLSGDLNIYGVLQLKVSLLEALQQSAALDIDLAELETIDGAGLQVLALLHREAGRAGKPLRLSGGTESLMNVITMVGMQRYFNEAPTPRVGGGSRGTST